MKAHREAGAAGKGGSLSAAGVLWAVLVLAALWWAWNVYVWLTSTFDSDEGGVRLVMLASMAAMFGGALAMPPTFSSGSSI
jgi:low temperature requirement protein LtrA